MAEPIRAEIALKECPFCGGESSFGTVKYQYSTVRENGWDQDTFHYANCMYCGSCNRGLVGHASQMDAAHHWNTRVSSQVGPDGTTPQGPPKESEGDRNAE